jgi:hypothetical protein
VNGRWWSPRLDTTATTCYRVRAHRRQSWLGIITSEQQKCTRWPRTPTGPRPQDTASRTTSPAMNRPSAPWSTPPKPSNSLRKPWSNPRCTPNRQNKRSLDAATLQVRYRFQVSVLCNLLHAPRPLELRTIAVAFACLGLLSGLQDPIRLQAMKPPERTVGSTQGKARSGSHGREATSFPSNERLAGVRRRTTLHRLDDESGQPWLPPGSV